MSDYRPAEHDFPPGFDFYEHADLDEPCYCDELPDNGPSLCPPCQAREEGRQRMARVRAFVEAEGRVG